MTIRFKGDEKVEINRAFLKAQARDCLMVLATSATMLGSVIDKASLYFKGN